MPDGMTIDDEDNLWVALYGGGAVIKVNPSTGDLLQVCFYIFHHSKLFQPQQSFHLRTFSSFLENVRL